MKYNKFRKFWLEEKREKNHNHNNNNKLLAVIDNKTRTSPKSSFVVNDNLINPENKHNLYYRVSSPEIRD